jgi:ariadne-1
MSRDSLTSSNDSSTYDDNNEDEEMEDVESGVEDNDNDEPSDWFLDEDEAEEEEPTFTILPKEGVVKTQKELIDQVISQVNLSPADTALLLQYFNWNSEKLLREYFDKPEYYLKEAGIFPSSPPASSSAPAQVTCIICYETIPANRTFTLGCGHKWYCLSCWREYLKEQTTKLGSQVVNTKCIYPKCPAKVNQEVFKKLADPKDFERYMYFFTKNYVESDKHLSFCPNAQCGNAVRFHGVGRPTEVVECTCGAKFCFSCAREQHSPVSCKTLEQWQLRNEDDQESLRLISATSKQCYHCGMPTERTQGCNHMTCRKEQGGCGGEWCWMCRGDWKTHGQHTGGFYSCNKYEQSDAKKVDDEAARLKAESDRFLHYFTRYFNHDVLNKHAEKLKREIVTKMDQFRELTNQNPDFLMEAVELLIECRRILKYTYVYGFYLEEGPAKTFFEYLQANAEGITERLSESVAAPVNQINAEDLKNRIRVTKKYINNLVKGIEEGLGVEAGGKAK